MDSNEMLTERIVVLETEGKTKDREIKELKISFKDEVAGIYKKINVLTESQNSLILNNQTISSQLTNVNSKMDDLKEDFKEKLKPVVEYIEELKKQPKKEMDKFKWLMVVTAVGALSAFVGHYWKW